VCPVRHSCSETSWQRAREHDLLAVAQSVVRGRHHARGDIERATLAIDVRAEEPIIVRNHQVDGTAVVAVVGVKRGHFGIHAGIGGIFEVVADSVEYVVRDRDPPCRLGAGILPHIVSIRPRDVKYLAGAADNVVGDRHVLADTEWRSSIGIARRQNDRRGLLAGAQAEFIFHHVAREQDALCALDLDLVLDQPVIAVEAQVVWIVDCQLLKVVAGDHDVTRYELVRAAVAGGDRWIVGAEENRRGGGLQVVVRDQEWPGAVPAEDAVGFGV
jgi:hypothetical protein